MDKVTRMLLLMLVSGFALTAVAADMPVMPYDSLMEDRVSADGWVEREEEFEYPAEFKNPATGLTVSWGFDDRNMYVALETKGKGWEAWLKKRGFTGTEAKQAITYANAEEGEVKNLWNIVNGVTAYARSIQHTDNRVNLETRAGNLLKYVSNN